jgi:hypothetical protein
MKLLTNSNKLTAICFAATLLVGHSALAEKHKPASMNVSELPKNYQTVIRGYYSMPGRLLDPYSAVYRFTPPQKGYVKAAESSFHEGTHQQEHLDGESIKPFLRPMRRGHSE